MTPRAEHLVVALDLSSTPGVAWLRDGVSHLFWNLKVDEASFRGLPHLLINVGEYEKYPWSYLKRAQMVADAVASKLPAEPYVAVIEETNMGQSRYTQKMLEMIHNHVLRKLGADANCTRVDYVSSSTWRSVLNVKLTKEDKAENARLSKAKRAAKKKGAKLDKKALGVAGKITLKHKSVQHVNARWGLHLKIGQNDIADALCLGEAYLLGAELATPSSSARE